MIAGDLPKSFQKSLHFVWVFFKFFCFGVGVACSDVPIIGNNRLTNRYRSADAMIDYVLS